MPGCVALMAPDPGPQGNCRRCGKSARFRDEAGLCGFCQGEELEAQMGLRPGLFRALVQQILTEMDQEETAEPAAP